MPPDIICNACRCLIDIPPVCHAVPGSSEAVGALSIDVGRTLASAHAFSVRLADSTKLSHHSVTCIVLVPGGLCTDRVCGAVSPKGVGTMLRAVLRVTAEGILTDGCRISFGDDVAATQETGWAVAEEICLT